MQFITDYPFFTFCEVNEAPKMKNIGNKKAYVYL